MVERGFGRLSPWGGLARDRAGRLDVSAAREHWVVRGEEVPDEEIGAAHEEFYATHPRVVEVGIDKKGEVLRRLGWTP